MSAVRLGLVSSRRSVRCPNSIGDLAEIRLTGCPRAVTTFSPNDVPLAPEWIASMPFQYRRTGTRGLRVGRSLREPNAARFPISMTDDREIGDRRFRTRLARFVSRGLVDTETIYEPLQAVAARA